MPSAAGELTRAIAAFRREHALGYARRRASEPLASERALEQLEAEARSGELAGSALSAETAHVARARLEHGYAPARLAQLELAQRVVARGGEQASVGALVAEWAASRDRASREQIARALEPALLDAAERMLSARVRADGSVQAMWQRIAPARHPDAGPERGASELAERWLAESEDVLRVSSEYALRKQGLDAGSGGDVLWASLGPHLQGLFAREGRARRVASDWEPLGLRRMLTAHARAAPAHAGLSVAAHVLPVSVPSDVRVSASPLEAGIASELGLAEGVGRALALAHASPALPLALRHPTVASVARALGALSVLRFTEPVFTRRVRGTSAREAETVARAAALYALLDARLAAAAVLARSLHGPAALSSAHALAERAVGAALPRALGALLVIRLSPGGPFRAKTHALGVAWALRDRYDADWFLNPRAKEPLLGAMARSGELSVEQFAEELGATPEQGLAKLTELF